MGVDREPCLKGTRIWVWAWTIDIPAKTGYVFFAFLVTDVAAVRISEFVCDEFGRV